MRKRNVVLLSMTLLSVFTYMDRLNIAVAGPRMMAELNLNEKQWGWILGSFILSYSLFQIPLGAIGDKKGNRWLLAIIVIWWSAFTSLTGLATGFVTLLVIRFMFGIGEAGAYPCMSSVIGNWFPKTERGKAQGFVWGGSRAGGALAPLLIVPFMALFGWRPAFWALGLLGVIWGAWWVYYFRNKPSEMKSISEQELKEIEVDRENDKDGKLVIPWRKFLTNKQFWLLLSMYWFYVWGSWFYFSWLHTYLVKGRGFSEGEMGWAASLPFVLGMGSNILGGYVSDSLSKKYGLKIGRRLIGVICLAVSALFLIGAGLAPGKLMVVVFLSVSFGVMDFMLPSAWALCVDLGGKYAGSLSGAMNTAGNLGGFACAVLFGYFVEAFGNYNAPLFVIAAMLLTSSVLFLRINPDKPFAT
jgi:MFS transporter, ACS family, glucarate transporter